MSKFPFQIQNPALQFEVNHLALMAK